MRHYANKWLFWEHYYMYNPQLKAHLRKKYRKLILADLGGCGYMVNYQEKVRWDRRWGIVLLAKPFAT